MTTKPKRKTARELTPISEQEMAFCHLLITRNAKNRTEAQCAEMAGFPPKSANVLKRKPRIQQYLMIYQTQFAAMMAQQEVDKMLALDIDRSALVRKLWMLANITPERTRGTITGQVDAIEQIAGMLGYQIEPRNMSKFFDGKTDEQVKNYLDYGSFEAPVAN
jgi:hypothetical protein